MTAFTTRSVQYALTAAASFRQLLLVAVSHSRPPGGLALRLCLVTAAGLALAIVLPLALALTLALDFALMLPRSMPAMALAAACLEQARRQ